MTQWKKSTILFLISQAITLFGSAVVQFAIVWYVTKTTSSGVLIALLTICAFVPQFIISFVSGSWADRYSKRFLIIAADTLIAITTLALAIMIPYISESGGVVAALLIVSAIRSVGAGIQTPAVNAMLQVLVPQDRLMRYNGVNASMQSVVQFAAPAAAGAVLSLGSLRDSLFIDIATAVTGIALLFCVMIPKASKIEGTKSDRVLSDMKHGMRYTFKHSFIRILLPAFGVFIFLCVPAGFLATLFVSRSYGDSYINMTLVEVIGFIGMLGGGLLIGTWGGFKNRVATLLTGMTAFGILAIGMGIVDNFVIYLILMAIYGIALTMIQTAVTTLLQEKSELSMQGRVFGFMNVMYSGALPLGMAVFGVLADQFNIRLLMIASGVLLLVLSLILLLNRSFVADGKLPASAVCDECGASFDPKSA